jgi:hypothetical protein
MKHIVHIPEHPGVGRLGRHVEHDARSFAFETEHARAHLVSASWRWSRRCAPFDQGDMGSCTGNAVAGAAMTAPLWRAGRNLTEVDAVRCYSDATRWDRIPGHFPPDDTGSTGLAAAKAGVRLGWFRSYRHAFDLHAALASLGRGPVVVGINWYEGFDRPIGDSARLEISGSVRGGHEIELLEINVDDQFVRGPNSWGTAWGDKGYFTMTWDTLGRLLAEDGDCRVLIP